jgi:hypothetical protein
MNQSSTIAFFLIAGFIVYITMRGELTKYVSAIFISLPPSQASQPTVVNPLTSETAPGLSSQQVDLDTYSAVAG